MGDLDEIKKYVMEGRDVFAEDARGHCALDAAVVTVRPHKIAHHVL